jgi:hypothetical protein
MAKQQKRTKGPKGAKKTAKNRRRTQARRQARTAELAAREKVNAEIRSFIDDVFEPGSPPERAAETFLKQFRDCAVPPELVTPFVMSKQQDRVRELAREVLRQAPGSLGALTFAADVAAIVERDADRAADLLDDAMKLDPPAGDRVLLGYHLGVAGRVAEGLDVVEALLVERADDPWTSAVYAELLDGAQRRVRRAAPSAADATADAGVADDDGDDADDDGGSETETDSVIPQRCPCRSGNRWSQCCLPRERAALRRFDDRSRLTGLWSGVADFVASDPELTRAVDRHVAQWLDMAGGWRTGEQRDTALAMAVEHAWLAAGGMAGREADSAADSAAAGAAEPGGDKGGTADAGAGGGRGGQRNPVARYAGHPDTPPENAAALRTWDDEYDYGLWLVVEHNHGPGVWTVEILTGALRYLSMPAADRAAVLRWSVLLGAVVPVDGVWRTGSAVVHLTPAEADMCAEIAVKGFDVFHRTMATGTDVEPEPFPPPGEQATFGVGATSREPAGREEAAFIGKVDGVLTPGVLATIHEWRDISADQTVNTDGHRLCAAGVSVRIADPDAVRRGLLNHPDIGDVSGIGDIGDIGDVGGVGGVEADGVGDMLVWWGRPLDHDELTMVDDELEMTRDEFLEAYHDVDELDEVGAADAMGRRRWARGQILIQGDTLQLETNSAERVDAFLDLMRETGTEIVIVDRLVFGPPPDLVLRRGNALPHLAMDYDELEDWAVEWLDDPMPGLSGRSPAAAMRRGANHALVETALRELEHDVDGRARAGLLTPDVDYLRRRLALPRKQFLSRAVKPADRFW